MMRKGIFGLALVAALAGCATTPDDSRLGSAYTALKSQQADYCATTSPVLRGALLVAIRARVPDYPPSGLCTDADKAIADEIAQQVADLPEGATVSIEQAREDQERFSE